MTSWRLVRCSLWHHRRLHAGVLLGSALAGAVLTGALLVGDSVRASLAGFTRLRLGRVEQAVDSGDRRFRQALADDLAAALSVVAAPALRTAGVAVAGAGERRLNRVEILGTDARFWTLAASPVPVPELAPGEAAVSQVVARRLGLKPGDELLLRTEPATWLPRDLQLAPETGAGTVLRCTVRRVLADTEMGRFSLRASQIPPPLVLVPLADLARLLEADDQANLLLLAPTPGAALAPEALGPTLRRLRQPADLGLEIRALPDGAGAELTTPRVFLDAEAERAAFAAIPGAQGVFTYFVNTLACGSRQTPYSFVTALGRMPDAAGEVRVNPGEIVLSDWLADDLGAAAGDAVTLAYYVPGPLRTLEERTTTLRVRQVVPLDDSPAARLLMPPFPGLADAENCRDWKPGLPLDLDRIRPRDEEYWDRYRGTPKAGVSLATAQELWGNRFGRLTAVRFPAEAGTPAEIADRILAQMPDTAGGLAFRPVRAEGLQASRDAVDFGQLFLGLSFFLIVAALLLTALLFTFAVEQRAPESGTLLALGFTRAQVRRLLLAEGLLLALTGNLIGLPAGIGVTRLFLLGLNTLWRDAVQTGALSLAVRPASLAAGFLAGTAAALLALWLGLRPQAHLTVLGLQAGAGRRSPLLHAWAILGSAVLLAAGSVGAAVLLVKGEPQPGPEAAAVAFSAAVLALLAALALFHLLLAVLAGRNAPPATGVGAVGRRAAARQPGRSLTAAAMLACGILIVVTVAANRRDPRRESDSRAGGTGGFAYFAETARPVPYNPNTAAGRRALGLDEERFHLWDWVTLRASPGDDASCLNLNRAQRPPLLGVDPAALAGRRAFSFAALFHPGADPADPWHCLERAEADGAVPAVADEAVIAWGLGKKLGDTLDYTDEAGRPFRVRLVGALAGSVLQGNVLISEASFLARYPSSGGWQVALVGGGRSAPPGSDQPLLRALADYGLEVTPTAERLAAFQAVENTYLSIFLVLGALGVMLGSAGLGVIVLRTVAERRGELALLQAVGWRRGAVLRLLLAEHGLLLGAGLACGVAAGGLAVTRAVWTAPWRPLGLAVGGIAATGLLAVGLAAAWATRGRLTAALRGE